jgi:alpha-beta hydrolase superfamily lysophospholipase
MTYARTSLQRDITLALHVWTPEQPHTVVFYVHGTQSHAGWMFETGPALAQLGCAVFALDRRGSGESEGLRGDVASFDVWIEDYLAAMAHARTQHPHLPMLLVGQSFGGAIAVGLACDARASHDAMILCSPLIVPRPGFDLWKDAAEDQPVRVPAPDEWYTSDATYLDFIKRDDKMTRGLTRRFHAARLALADHYNAAKTPLANKPCALVVPRSDRMIDLAAARDAYHRLSGNTGIVIELPGTDHFLEFSPGRHLLWRLQASFARAFHTA